MATRLEAWKSNPSRHDVEVAIEGLEIEDEREKEAIRRFYDRHRDQQPGLRVSFWGLVCFLGKTSLIAIAAWLLIVWIFNFFPQHLP